ncbi:MAG TPA: redoxin domain-containing protein [Phycisphaerales bacterium]|jgi:peroxiredoxin|nr:redoxin domain-containing protein [Phycisphaerales bacterium]
MMRKTWFMAATVACVAFAGSAFAQVNDDAKAVLNESAKAIKELQGVQFDVKTYATGMLKDIIDLSGTVKMWRPPTGPVQWMVDGRAKDPGKQDRKLQVFSDGTVVVWNNYNDNIQYTSPATEPNAMESANMCRELILQDWTSPTPFNLELTQFPNLTKTGINNVNGEVCDVVEAMPSGKDRNRTWCISVKDRLPRSLELGTGNMAQKISKITEMTNVKPMKFTQKDFELPLPTGFIKKDLRVKAEAPVNTPTPAPDLGMPKGSEAPAFNAKDTAGNDVSKDAMKGHVFVMEFWGTLFKQSTAHANDMKALAEKMPSAKFVGFACKSPDKAATDWWHSSGPGYPLVVNADHIASDYKVAGYPSYYVISPKGTVAAFFQDFPGTDKLATAIDEASK